MPINSRDRNWSTPAFPSSFGLGEPFIPRRRSTTDKLFSEFQQSPLHDLAPLAQPGITTRVTRNNSVAISMDALADPFEFPTAETVVTMEGGLTAPLVWAAGVAVLSSFQNGFSSANMNTAAEVMRADLGVPSTDAANDTTWGFCVSVFCLGALVGCSMGASLADSAGRKRTLLATSVVYALGALGEASSALARCAPGAPCAPGAGVALLIGGRVVTGVACGATSVVVPMYLGEVSPPHLRGFLGTVHQLLCVVGMLVAQVLGLPALLGTRELWPLYLLLVLVPAAALLALRSRLAESPSWLSRRSQEDAQAAQAILARLRGEPPTSLAVLKELDFMQVSGSAELEIPGYKYGVRQMLRDTTIRNGLTITVVCAVAQQFSGINNAFNFSSAFLAQNGIGASTVTLIAVLMNVGNVLITLLSASLMDSAGRRPLLLGSAAGMVVSALGLTAALTHPGQAWTPAVAVVTVVGFVMSFGIGMGPIPWLLPAELFPVDKCARVSSLAAQCNWLANFVVGQVFLPVSAALGGFCFLPFALILVGFIAFAHRRVPETRGKTLEQIISDLNA